MVAVMLATAILALVNHERAKHDVPLLRLDPRLTRTARHCGDSNLLRCVNRWYATQVTGRNMAYGQRTPRAAVRAWMKSPPHREILLLPKYRRTGIVVFPRRHVWIEIFAR